MCYGLMNQPPESPAAGRYHHGDLRRALLEAAAKAPDIEHISLRELASGLGVSAAAVYRHFDSREALLAELAAVGIAQLQQRFADAFDLHAPAADAPEAVARLHRLAVAYLRFADEQPAMWRLIFGAYAVQTRANALQTGAPTSYSYLPAALQGLYRTGVIVEQPAQGEVEHVGAEVVQRILRGIGADGP